MHFELIGTTDGEIPTARIVRFCGDFVEYDAGGGVLLKAKVYHGYRDLERLQGSVVPAAPGYQRVKVYADDDPDDPFVALDPIVAWRVWLGVAEPVTPDDTVADYAVLYPDGRVVAPCIESYASLDAYVTAMVERARRAKPQEAA